MPRRDFSKVAFAATGDTNVIPTPTQPDGSISLQTGWGFDYQRDNGAGGGTPDPLAKNIDREDMNGILNEITSSVGEIQQNGVPIWVSSAAPYPINAIARESNIVWRNTIANNSATPSAVSSGWENISVPTSGKLLNIQRITATGVYTPTAGTRKVVVELVGGGGGGGGAAGTVSTTSSAGSGGGGGAYAKSLITSGFSGAAITIGAGGSAGAGTGSGGAGGATSFGALLSANGGGPGAASDPASPFPNQLAGGIGGAIGTSGNIQNGKGGEGMAAVLLRLANGVGGSGGSSAFSAGAQRNIGTAGNAGSFGGGGSGGLAQAGQSGSLGGAGGAGLVIVWEYE